MPSAPSIPFTRLRFDDEAAARLTRYSVQFAVPVARELRVALELGKEDEGFWASAPSLGMTAEGADLGEALTNLVSAIREWLLYLREESPRLGEDLAGQERYVAL